MQNPVDGIRDGHVDSELLIQMKCPIRTIEPFRHHVHFHDGPFDAIPFTNHHPQCAVSAMGTVRCDQQIPEVGAFLHVSVVLVHGCKKPLHLLGCIGN